MDKLAVAVGLLGLTATLSVLVLHTHRAAFRRVRLSTFRMAVALGLATAGVAAIRVSRQASAGGRGKVLALFGAMAFGIAAAALADLVDADLERANLHERARLAIALGTIGRAISLLLAVALIALTLDPPGGLTRVPAVLAAFILGAALVAVLGTTRSAWGAEVLAATVVSAAVAGRNEAALRALGADPLAVALLPLIVYGLASLGGLAGAMAIAFGEGDQPGDAEGRGLLVMLGLLLLAVFGANAWWLRVPAWGFSALAGVTGIVGAWGTLLAFRHYRVATGPALETRVHASGLTALTIGLEGAMVVTGIATFVLVASHACGDVLPLARGGNLGAATAVAALAGTRSFVEGATSRGAAPGDERPAAHGLLLGALGAFLLLESAGELEIASDAAVEGAVGAAIVGVVVVLAWALLKVRARLGSAIVLLVPLTVAIALRGRGEALLVMAMVATVVGVATASVLARLADGEEPRHRALGAAAAQLPHLVLTLAALPAALPLVAR